MPGDISGLLSFESASLFLLVLPLVLLLLWDFVSRRHSSTVPLTGLEYLVARNRLTGRRRKLLRTGLWLLVIAGTGLLWAGPSLHTPAPVFRGGEQTLQKNLVVAIDISASMGGPLKTPDRAERLAAFVKKGRLNRQDQGPTRYESARQTLFDFMERFQGARIGLILFSTEPFLARWPTAETASRFMEVLEEQIGPGETSQLQRFSSLTNTDKALELAREIFANQQAVQGGAVILITDAEDELGNMGVAIRKIRERGIRLYTIGVGISEIIVSKLSREFANDPGFRIFRVDSEEDMQEAYRLVSEVEESPKYAADARAYTTELRWLLALLLAVAAAAVLLAFETVLHQSQVAGRDADGSA